MNTKVVITIICALSSVTMVAAQNEVGRLQPLVETSVRRLEIARQVALSKWDSRMAVEDPLREAQVIQGAVNSGISKGLTDTLVKSFFKAQIEANKIIQYSLLADWSRAGSAPAHASVNLAGTIRPQLDEIQADLIARLADTAVLRASSSCHGDVAKAVGAYLNVHSELSDPLRRIALDRSLATLCDR